MKRMAVLALLLMSALLMGVDRPSGLGDILDVRYWSYPDYTRIVVELDRPVPTEVIRLAADSAADRPERFCPGLNWRWLGGLHEAGVAAPGVVGRVGLQARGTAAAERLVQQEIQRLQVGHLETLDIPVDDPCEVLLDTRGCEPSTQALVTGVIVGQHADVRAVALVARTRVGDRAE